MARDGREDVGRGVRAVHGVFDPMMGEDIDGEIGDAIGVSGQKGQGGEGANGDAEDFEVFVAASERAVGQVSGFNHPAMWGQEGYTISILVQRVPVGDRRDARGALSVKEAKDLPSKTE